MPPIFKCLICRKDIERSTKTFWKKKDIYYVLLAWMKLKRSRMQKEISFIERRQMRLKICLTVKNPAFKQGFKSLIKV